MSAYTLDKVIIVSGRICSGKTTIAKLLSDRLSFPFGSFGGYLSAYSQHHKLKTDREGLQELGQQKVQTNPSQFVKDVIEFYRGVPNSIVLDGIRHRIIFDKIKELTRKPYSVYVEADVETRYQRYLLRANIDYPAFLLLDNHPVELETETLKPFCDVIVDTTIPFEDVLSGFLRQILAT